MRARWGWKRVLGLLFPDRATGYAVGSRVWQALAGPVTMVLLARCMSVEVQGYYYTFASLMGLQTLLEMGLVQVILHQAGHAWAEATKDDPRSPSGQGLARIAGLWRASIRWYALASLAFLGIAGGAGWMLFTVKGPGISWRGPWCLSVLLQAVTFWTLPMLAILEACGRNQALQKARMAAAPLASLAFWGVLLLGGGLWATTGAAAVLALRDLYLLSHAHRDLAARFLAVETSASAFRWEKDVWPLQWRIGVSGVASYFVFSFLTPMAFHQLGPAVAGRLGMTLQVVNLIQTIAQGWLAGGMPGIPVLLGKGNVLAAQACWLRLLRQSLGAVIFLSLSALVTVWFFNMYVPNLGERFLPQSFLGTLLVGGVGMHLNFCLASFIRAHRVEPAWWIAVLSGGLTAGLAWHGVRWWGLWAVPIAYGGVVWVLILPLVRWQFLAFWSPAPRGESSR